MKPAKYIWEVVKDIIALAVILGAFSVANTKFETVVIAMLVFIYLTLTAYFMGWGKLNFAFLDFFIKNEQNMRKLLKEKISEYEEEAENEAFKKYTDMKDKTEKLAFINAIYIFIAYLITLFILITSTLAS
jgi:hypothetical protein